MLIINVMQAYSTDNLAGCVILNSPHDIGFGSIDAMAVFNPQKGVFNFVRKRKAGHVPGNQFIMGMLLN